MNKNRLGQMILLDKTTSEWFNKHPEAQTTVTKCEKCNLWYKASLGHDCVRDGIVKLKTSSLYGEMKNN